MPNFLIRNVPSELHDRLVAGARAQGRALQQHLRAVVALRGTAAHRSAVQA